MFAMWWHSKSLASGGKIIVLAGIWQTWFALARPLYVVQKASSGGGALVGFSPWGVPSMKCLESATWQMLPIMFPWSTIIGEDPQRCLVIGGGTFVDRLCTCTAMTGAVPWWKGLAWISLSKGLTWLGCTWCIGGNDCGKGLCSW